MLPARVIQHLQTRLNESIEVNTIRQLNGSSLNSVWFLNTQRGEYFVKTNEASYAHMMAAEHDGLVELERARAVRVPVPVTYGVTDNMSYLVLEFVELQTLSINAQEKLGHALARLHEHTANQHGWHRNNTIGLTLQTNHQSSNWLEFFRQQRLLALIDLLEKKPSAAPVVKQAHTIVDNLDRYLGHINPAAALLHGDLWSGNVAMLSGGEPIVYDPAVYFGDRESDIAMAGLFGGFEDRFYAAYRETWPDTEDGKQRRNVYRLYHLLNHCLLFGAGYYAQTLACINRIKQ